MDLSLNLKALVSQLRLIPREQGRAASPRWRSCSTRRWWAT